MRPMLSCNNCVRRADCSAFTFRDWAITRPDSTLAEVYSLASLAAFADFRPRVVLPRFTPTHKPFPAYSVVSMLPLGSADCESRPPTFKLLFEGRLLSLAFSDVSLFGSTATFPFTLSQSKCHLKFVATLPRLEWIVINPIITWLFFFVPVLHFVRSIVMNGHGDGMYLRFREATSGTL